MKDKYPKIKDLLNISKKINKEGRLKGLTDSQLDKRKNWHWDALFSHGVTFIRILSIILCAWIAYILVAYSVYLTKDCNRIELLLSKITHYLFIVLVTLGGESLIKKFKK